MKFQIMAWGVTAFFGAAITWIKLNGGKITAWLRVVGDLCKFTADMNDTCADGKAEPEEMQRICTDWNQFMADLGLIKKGALEKMKKPIIAAVIALFAVCLSTPAHADIWGKETPQHPRLMASAVSVGDLNTILDVVTQVSGRLGVREGYFYDFERKEVTNYAAATAYTFQPYGISIDFGVLNLDGFAVTADYNIGALVPPGDPLTNLLQYAYVGAGGGAREKDGGWKAAYGITAQFKFTA